MLLGTWLLPLALAASGSARTELEAVRAVLLRTEACPTLSEPALVRRLASLGQGAAPALFSLVSGTGTDELLGSSDDPAAWLCAPDRVGELALAALGSMPPTLVLEELRLVEARGPEREVRMAEVRVLGSLRSAQAVDFLFQLMGAFAEDLALHSVREQLKGALLSILAQDALGFRALEEQLAAAPLAQLELVGEALSSAGSPEGAAALETLLGRDPALDLLVLDGLTELELTYPWRMERDVRELLLPRLAAQAPELRAACARALGRLRDGRAVPGLIARLGDPDATVARAALWAVREISGRADLADEEGCQAWLAAESTWWNEEGAALLEESGSDDPARLVANLRTLLAHPLGRASITDRLVDALPDAPPDTQRVGCRALASLGATGAVPTLIELLASTDEGVRQAAFQALRSLTGQDLPPEPGLWEEYAFG